MLSHSLTSELPRWAVMWGVAGALYGALKMVSWVGRPPGSPAPFWRHLAYLVAWPGMDAEAFLLESNAPVNRANRPALGEWAFAVLKLCLGLGLLFGDAARRWTGDPYLGGWMGMLGIVFALHFGLFHLLSCFWRSLGVRAVPLMNWPIASQSLAEFWGRRWNLAFRDLTHRFLFRPLVGPLGPAAALLTGFLVSGLVHDAVISLPAGGGWGRPTGYFLLQGGGLLIERSRVGRRLGLGRGTRGRLFAAAVLLAPVSLLFHRPFVNEVIVPFLSVLRGVL